MKTFIKLIISFIIPILAFSCDFNHSDILKKQATIDSLNNQVKILSYQQNLMEANKKMVATFYQELFGDKNLDAIDVYLRKDYIQHNPGVTDGSKALKDAAALWFKNAPKEKIDIQHIGADGDLVFIHLKSKRGEKTFSVIDIFRIENGKIAEHWDVIQEVPSKSLNSHPMF